MQATTTGPSYFGGRFRKIILPAFTPPIPATPPPKRLLLAQGELAHCYDGAEGMRYIAFLELRVGGVRSNHYHRFKQEWLYVASGKIRLWVEDMQVHQRESLEVNAGEMVIIDCGLAHAFQTAAPGYAVEFSPVRFDAADSYPFALV